MDLTTQVLTQSYIVMEKEFRSINSAPLKITDDKADVSLNALYNVAFIGCTCLLKQVRTNEKSDK